MQRNLDRRVEALVPVRDPALSARVEEILRANLEDDTLAWELGADGTWTKTRGESVSVHERLLALAVGRAAGGAPESGSRGLDRGVATPGSEAGTVVVVNVEVRAAGGLVWRRGKGGVLEIALVHRPKYDDWTLPKGKMNPGETEEEAAVREVEEETGLRCVLERVIGRIHYVDRRGRPKTVRYWIMRPLSGSFVPSQEVDEMRWLPVDEAAAQLSYEHDRELLRRLAHPATTMSPGLGRRSSTAVPMYLVRHAKARSRPDWKKGDHLRPLSDEGKRQAEGLVAMLDGSPIEQLISSPHVRCVQTLQPLAIARGLTVEESEDLAEGAGPARALAFLAEMSGRPAAFCSHGDVIGEVLLHLSAEGLELPSPLPLRKGSTWVLEAEGDGFVGARYLPPP